MSGFKPGKTWFIICSGVILLISGIISMFIGEVDFPLFKIHEILTDPSCMEYGILTHIRIPRTILAMSVGGSLSLSGAILQGIYRNPLVEPYTLGISGGASVGVTLAILTGLNSVTRLSLPLSGFAGAFATVFIVYTISVRKGALSIERMLLVGVMVSFISSSVVMFLMSVTTVEQVHSIIFWTMGSLNESDISVVMGLMIFSIVMLAVSYILVIPLNALRMGESKARNLGINSGVVVKILFVLTSLLTGCCIAVAGVIGFVGLIIPHVTRFITGTDYRILLVSSFLNGGIFLVWCDILARIIVSQNELPIGVITGIFGGIAFIFIISSSKSKTKIL
jgi:iron complex transport system permease protein